MFVTVGRELHPAPKKNIRLSKRINAFYKIVKQRNTFFIAVSDHPNGSTNLSGSLFLTNNYFAKKEIISNKDV